ncbi:MAG: uncharacterized protein QOI38_69 [Sphingomonadales bacterium]|jgi:secreted PhoX family phosphatase|nr:uncharacterized protein [Sphingomonadales bacterium]
MLTRRDFGFGLASAAFGGLALSGCAKLSDYAARLPALRVDGMRTLPDQPRLVRDTLPGLLDLREGLEVSIVSSRAGELGGSGTMTDERRIPDKADGMGSFRLGADPDRVVLVRNHELEARDRLKGAFPGGVPPEVTAYRPHGGEATPGGTSNILYNCRTGEVERETLTLVGTLQNCAGGVTPWGTWLTCEENVSAGHGYVFEVPALQQGLEPLDGAGPPVPLTAMGRFNHEAAAVDPRTGFVYLTEDRRDGLFYRFLPGTPGRLRDGGTLQALAFADGFEADARNWTSNVWTRESGPRRVRWVTLDAMDSQQDDLRKRGHRCGAVRFACGEGIHFGDGEIFFCCTSGGPIRSGQIMRYRPPPDEAGRADPDVGEPGLLDIFLEVTDPGVLNYCDNLAVAPNGHLIACEDTYVAGEDGFYLARPVAEALGAAPSCYLRGITPAGQVYDIARLRGATELAGVCFSPDGSCLFVNHYSPATTLAIRARDGGEAPWLPRNPRWRLYDASGADWFGRGPGPGPSAAASQCSRPPRGGR